jgi:hypothetical protein
VLAGDKGPRSGLFWNEIPSFLFCKKFVGVGQAPLYRPFVRAQRLDDLGNGQPRCRNCRGHATSYQAQKRLRIFGVRRLVAAFPHGPPPKGFAAVHLNSAPDPLRPLNESGDKSPHPKV